MVGRTRLRLDYSFFWILTFAAWAQNELLWQVLLFSVLHECGHLTALCALGLQPRQLRLSFYGMALRYDRVPDRRRETAVLFGGPVVNLILWVLLRNPANGALFLLNMLPIFPLDGGRLAALWLPQRLAGGAYRARRLCAVPGRRGVAPGNQPVFNAIKFEVCMRKEIEKLLQSVQKPARYAGGELNSVMKDKSKVALRYAFCFPDTYEIGMSHLGMKILYGVANAREDTWCERVFAPADDMEALMRANGEPLFALESGDPIKDFDMIGFTMQYELSYTNILNMLDLAGVPLRAVDRKSLTPIVAFGGPCACNPEPVAEFADIIFLGEGEETTNTVLDLLKKCKESGKSKQEFLEAAMHIQGIYVPSFYEDSYNPDGTLCALTPTHGAPATVKKSIVSDMNKCYYPDSFVVPFIDIVHDRAVEEIFRGCIRGCRFCQAGFIYRPIREKSVETINRQSKALIDSTGYDELSLCSLSTSDHSCVNEMLTSLIDWTVRDKINLSLPSLRVDNFSDELVDKLSKVRRSGLTFAPEAGTQRMRDVINKNVTEEEVLRTCTKAFAGGWTSVKLYFMMGLPTETMEDIAGIAQLAGKVVDAYYNTPEHKKGCAVSVSVSCASFIPKPFTPFQWEPEDTMTSLKAKQAHLLESVPSRKIRVSYHETPTSLLEGVLARGDRRLSKVLLRAFELGCKFDSWDDHFNFDAWMQAFEECGLDPDFYTKRRRPFEELLPWDHLDYGVSRKFLELENKRAHQNVTTPHCRIRCAGCGANKLNGGHCDARPEVARDTTAVQ